MQEHTERVLREMCRRVGAAFEKIDFNKDGWYRKYTWTPNEEIAFKNWMITYLKKNRMARVEIMGDGYNTPNMIEKSVNAFLLDYGWKLTILE